MLIQDKQFFHQQHLGTCVNNVFLYTDLCSVCTAAYLFIPWWRHEMRSALRLEGSSDVLQRSRVFLMETYISEKVVPSENLSMFTFIFIT